MSPELTLVLRLFGLVALVLLADIQLHRPKKPRRKKSPYRDYKIALKRTYGGHHAHHR